MKAELQRIERSQDLGRVTISLATGGSVRLQLLSGETLQIIYQGPITAEVVSTMIVELGKLISPYQDVRNWVVDSLDVTSFELSSRECMNDVVGLFRDHGGRCLVLVTKNPTLSRLGASMLNAGEAPVRLLTSRAQIEQALRHIE